MPIIYNPWLVALSIVIAIQGGFVGFKLASSLSKIQSAQDRLRLIGAAASLATGIWAMHFIGMLAASFPVQVDFLAVPTLLSLLICGLVVGLAVYATRVPLNPRLRVVVGGVVMGIGIALMHYVGMLSVNGGGEMVYGWPYVVMSGVISVGGSAFAIWLIQHGGKKPPLWAGAIIFAVAVAGMHYTAMAGMTMQMGAAPHLVAAALSSSSLALLVAVVAFLISTVFLLSLIPQSGDIGSPARSRDAETPFAEPRAKVRDQTPPTQQATTLSVQHNGQMRLLALETVYAIRANAHYTYVFDGRSEYFCPLSMSEIEMALQHPDFLRVHRSHIVNIRHVATLRRHGDAGIAELQSVVQCKVPVARARYAKLKMQLRDRILSV